MGAVPVDAVAQRAQVIGARAPSELDAERALQRGRRKIGRRRGRHEVRTRTTSLERTAIDRGGVSLRDRLAEARQRILGCPVGPERARLPAGEARLVEEQEVEIRPDVRLAGRQSDAVAHLRVLIGGSARLGRRRRVGLAAGVVGDDGDVFRARVRRRLPGVDRRLRATLHVPDANTGGTRNRLSGAVEGEPEVVHELVPVALREDLRADVLSPGSFGGREAVGVVTDGVEERPGSSARAIGLSHGADERARRV
jgi:hypothetical protein